MSSTKVVGNELAPYPFMVEMIRATIHSGHDGGASGDHVLVLASKVGESVVLLQL